MHHSKGITAVETGHVSGRLLTASHDGLLKLHHPPTYILNLNGGEAYRKSSSDWNISAPGFAVL